MVCFCMGSDSATPVNAAKPHSMAVRRGPPVWPSAADELQHRAGGSLQRREHLGGRAEPEPALYCLDEACRSAHIQEAVGGH